MKSSFNSRDLLSPVAVSNLLTMGAAAKVDPRQAVASEPGTVLTPEVRLLRAKLAMEECFELLEALGVEANFTRLLAELKIKPLSWTKSMPLLDFEIEGEMNVQETIDACIDGIYVLTGTLMAMGVPDVPHAAEVNRANNAKFPGGKATVNESGKFQKPEGWTPPDHGKVLEEYKDVNLKKIQEVLLMQQEKKFVSNVQPEAPAENAGVRPPTVETARYTDDSPEASNVWYRGPGWYATQQTYSASGQPGDKRVKGPYPTQLEAKRVF